MAIVHLCRNRNYVRHALRRDSAFRLRGEESERNRNQTLVLKANSLVCLQFKLKLNGFELK